MVIRVKIQFEDISISGTYTNEEIMEQKEHKIINIGGNKYECLVCGNCGLLDESNKGCSLQLEAESVRYLIKRYDKKKLINLT